MILPGTGGSHPRLLLVTGKGGVGKSLVAWTLAQIWAEQQKRVLLLECAMTSQLAPLSGVTAHAHTRVSLNANIDVFNLDLERNLLDYARRTVPWMPQSVDRVFEHQLVRSLLSALPGLHELLLVGRLFHECKLVSDPYDIVIFDGFSSGHFLQFLQTPGAAVESTFGGPMAQEAQRVADYLQDADQTRLVYVTLTQDLPMSETLEFLPRLTGVEGKLALGGVVINRSVSPSDVEWQGAEGHPYLKRRLHDSAEARKSLRRLVKPAQTYVIPDLGFVEEPVQPYDLHRLVRELSTLNEQVEPSQTTRRNPRPRMAKPPATPAATAPTSTRAKSIVMDAKIILVLGAGGVGKTTMATALALGAARHGQRVALLSIDPARRLASALGLKIGSALTPVDLGSPVGPKAGSLHALMLDAKSVFDELVVRFSPTRNIAQSILTHPAYQAASSRLAGPQEYMALAKLCDIAESGEFDLVVVDTPPDLHALDFLARPNVLEAFSQNGVMRTLIKPFHLASRIGGSSLTRIADSLLGGVAKMTGLQALQNLASFMVLVQDIYRGLATVATRTSALLANSSTHRYVVLRPDLAALRSCHLTLGELQRLKMTVQLAIINQALPPEPDLLQVPALQHRLDCESAVLADLYRTPHAPTLGHVIIPESFDLAEGIQGLDELAATVMGARVDSGG